MHTYEMDEDVLDVILRTYAQVFERPRVWSARGNDMVMVASAEGDLKVASRAWPNASHYRRSPAK